MSRNISPPADLDAEAAVLSDLLLAPAHVDDAAYLLSARDFYSKANSLVFEAILALHGAQRQIDISVVAGWLRDRGHLDAAGGTPYLAQLIDATPAVAHVDEHARLVAGKAQQRRVIEQCQTIVAEGYGDVADPNDWAQSAAERVHAAAEGVGVTGGELLDDIYAETFREMDDVRSGKRASLLTRTGLHRLDAQLGGGLAAEPYLVAGRPGMGKSAFALSVGRNIARAGKGVLYLSAEMSSKQLGIRSACIESRVDVERANNPGALSPEEYTDLRAGANSVRKLPMFFWKKAQPKVVEIRSAAREGLRMLRRKHGADLELGLIIIDYIQVLNGQRTKMETRDEELARLSGALQLGMAGDFGCPVMNMSQLNRDCEKRPDKRPELSDLRGSGSLEADAYAIIMLYRDEKYFPNTPDQGVAECLVRKNRNGQEGVAKVAFHGASTMFDNLPGTY